MSSTTPPQPTPTRTANEASNDSPPNSRAPAWSDTESDAGAPPFVRDQEFWLDDGTVILIAHDTGFRVYRGLLAAQSPVFRNSFSFSSPYKSAEERIDGCPVVRLTDSPEDLRHLLRVILPVRRRSLCAVPSHNDGVVTFDQLSATIRLAHKYDIADVQKQGLDVLKTWFPSDFDAFEAWRMTYSKESQSPNYAIGAVNIARLTDTPEILPLALYMCYRQRGGVLDGWRREDGTVEHLDMADLRRCLNACDPLAKEGNDMRITLLNSEKCLQAKCSGAVPPCYDSIRALFTRQHFLNVGGPDGVLTGWAPHIRDRFCKSKCGECKAGLLDLEKRERRRIWSVLPKIFDLQGLVLGDERSDCGTEASQTVV